MKIIGLLAVLGSFLSATAFAADLPAPANPRILIIPNVGYAADLANMTHYLEPDGKSASLPQVAEKFKMAASARLEAGAVASLRHGDSVTVFDAGKPAKTATTISLRDGSSKTAELTEEIGNRLHAIAGKPQSEISADEALQAAGLLNGIFDKERSREASPAPAEAATSPSLGPVLSAPSSKPSTPPAPPAPSRFWGHLPALSLVGSAAMVPVALALHAVQQAVGTGSILGLAVGGLQLMYWGAVGLTIAGGLTTKKIGKREHPIERGALAGLIGLLGAGAVVLGAGFAMMSFYAG